MGQEDLDVEAALEGLDEAVEVDVDWVLGKRLQTKAHQSLSLCQNMKPLSQHSTIGCDDYSRCTRCHFCKHNLVVMVQGVVVMVMVRGGLCHSQHFRDKDVEEGA
jgi:hypothetical protein